MTSDDLDEYEEEFEEAERVLTPWYDEADNGDVVITALDALAGILCDRADIRPSSDKELLKALQKVKAPKDLRLGVKKLYDAAKRGSYGEGLSKKDARTINDVVQDLVEPLIEFIRAFDPKTMLSRKPPTGSRKRRLK